MQNVPYYNYQFNPMLTPQQRLTQMEQQYPQFAHPAPQSARALVVMDEAEAKAQQVPTDGTITVFINKAKNELYTKGLDNNGLLNFKTYTLLENPNPSPSSPLNEGDLEGIKQDIEMLKTEIKELRDVKQSNANDANVRTVKKQSKSDASDSNDVRE